VGPFDYHIIQGVEMKRRNDTFVTVFRCEDGGTITEIFNHHVVRGDRGLVSEGHNTSA